MTGVKRIAPLVLLLLLVIVGSHLLAPNPAPPASTSSPPPPPRRTLYPRPAPPPRLPEAPVASLSGLVLLEEEPAGSAWIAVTGPARELRQELDESGEFQFSEVPAGVPLDIWLGPDGQGVRVCRLAEGIVLKEGEHRRLELRAALPAAIRGIVRNRRGEPLEGVRVAVLRPEADWRVGVVAAITGEGGQFFVGIGRKEPPSALRLVVDHVAEGYILEERIVLPAAGVEVTLEMGLAIAGTARGPGGEPLADAEVHILEDYRESLTVRRPAEGRVRTDENGRFRDDAYRPGVYRIFLSGEFEGTPFGVVTEGVAAGTEDVDLRFEGFGSLSLTFEDDVTGAAIEVGYAVLDFIWSHEGEEEFYEPWVEAHDTREVIADHLPAGHYRVRVRHSGYDAVVGDLFYVEAGRALGMIRYRLRPTTPK